MYIWFLLLHFKQKNIDSKHLSSFSFAIFCFKSFLTGVLFLVYVGFCNSTEVVLGAVINHHRL